MRKEKYPEIAVLKFTKIVIIFQELFRYIFDNIPNIEKKFRNKTFNKYLYFINNILNESNIA